MGPLLDTTDIASTATAGMTCRPPRRKAALGTYTPRHLSSDRRILRNVGVVDRDCAQNQSGISHVGDAPQSTSNDTSRRPTNHSAKPSNTSRRADDPPAERASDPLRTKRYPRRFSVDMSTQKPSPTSGRLRSDGEASEAEKKGRRQSRRLLDTKRDKESNETSRPYANTVNIQLECTARPSSFAKRGRLVALPTLPCLEREEPFSTSDKVFTPLQNQIGVVQPEGWTKVHKTRLVGDAKKYWKKPDIERSLCVCMQPAPGSLEPGCDESCLNRAMDYECDSNNCGLGDLCTNREFAGIEQATSDSSSIGVEIIKTLDRGFGVCARRPYKPHQIIIEHTGEIITPNEADRRMKEDYKDKAVSCDTGGGSDYRLTSLQNYYQMGFDQGMILDATKGSVSRFVNHSCEPNCRMLKRFVEGQPRIALFAGDNGISTGEELTYDYNFK
jgi:histone-lysine N-methyltransferase ASH1L